MIIRIACNVNQGSKVSKFPNVDKEVVLIVKRIKSERERIKFSLDLAKGQKFIYIFWRAKIF